VAAAVAVVAVVAVEAVSKSTGKLNPAYKSPRPHARGLFRLPAFAPVADSRQPVHQDHLRLQSSCHHRRPSGLPRPRTALLDCGASRASRRCPSSSRPSSRKKSTVATRSSTTIRTLSIRLGAVSNLQTVVSADNGTRPDLLVGRRVAP
jgi:hypothetical protein